MKRHAGDGKKTLAALTTPPGAGGIGVVELHGDEAWKIASALFKSRRSALRLTAMTPHYGDLADRGGTVLDEVILRLVSGGDSLTGLDSAEIHCHGGAIPAKRILDLLAGEGAEIVSWKGIVSAARANGKIDCIQQEAMELLPYALTERAAAMLNAQWRGALSNAIASAKNEGDFRRLSETVKLGMALTRPLKVVIVGRPNSGKSTLFNALLEETKAVVYHEPGTTRDPVRGTIAVEGIPFAVVDTAGRGAPLDAIDKLGQERTAEELAAADIIILLVDAMARGERGEEDILREATGKPVIIAYNKIDLAGERFNAEAPAGALLLSALKHEGIDRLRSAILTVAGIAGGAVNSPVLFTERQAKLLERLLGHIDNENLRAEVVSRLVGGE